MKRCYGSINENEFDEQSIGTCDDRSKSRNDHLKQHYAAIIDALFTKKFPLKSNKPEVVKKREEVLRELRYMEMQLNHVKVTFSI